MIDPELDTPDLSLGRHDPFVNALRVWNSLDAMRRGGWPEAYIREVSRSMDAVMVSHRQTLVEQFMAADPVLHRNNGALRRRMGLEYWEDGQVLDVNDPEGEGHARCAGG